jgi:hypothetical protein
VNSETGHPDTEQRRAPRKRAEFTVEVIDVIQRRPIGQLGDLSRGGLMLISPRAPRDEAIYQLRVPLAGMARPDPTIEMGVQALWHRRAAVPGQVWAGYRIIAVNDDDSHLLTRWLALPT